MKNRLLLILLFIISLSMNTQNSKLPYNQIPEAPKNYTAGATVSRMIDGLGFRYYWATEGLTEKDLNFQPNKESRTTEQTINHILELSQVLVNSALHLPNGSQQPKMTFAEKRKKTLENLQKASQIFRKENDLSKFKMVFKRGENETSYDFWYQINGPISDALWHVGQVVSFRRSSGNPLPKGVNVLQGIKRN